MNRGDVHWVDFDPVVGSEAGRQRPAIIVSNDGANLTAVRLGRGVLTVVPITSNVERVYPFQVRIPAGEGGLSRESKAQAEQVRPVAFERMGARLGAVSGETLDRIDTALRLHLAL